MTGPLFALALAQLQLVTAAPGLAQEVPATTWSCTFETAEGSRFRLSGQIAAIPKGWDPNESRPTEVGGEGFAPLLGRHGATSQHASDYFREYQLSAYRGAERYNVNLRLRRGGAGVADITRYVENSNREPYSYLAAGLCTSDFDAADPPKGLKP